MLNFPEVADGPGVQAGTPLFFTTGWHTYNWAKYGPIYAPSYFSTLAIGTITNTTAVASLTPPYSGYWYVRYGTQRGTSQRTAQVACTGGVASNIPLSNLRPGTAYIAYACLVQQATDQTNQTVQAIGYSDPTEFVTTGGPGSPVAPVISNVSWVVSTNNKSCTITWKTDVPCVSNVKFGLTASYGNNAWDNQTPVNSVGATVVLYNLQNGNTYHFQCQSQGRDAAHSLVAQTTDATFNT